MTISRINGNEVSKVGNLSDDLTKISCLDEKIQHVAQKIITAHEDLRAIKEETREIKSHMDTEHMRSIGFSEDTISFMIGSYQDQLDGLKDQKKAVKTLIAANHEYLSHYERQLKKCITAFDQTYPNYRLSLLSSTVEAAKTEGRDVFKTVSYSPGRGIGLTELAPPAILKWQERASRIFERAMSCQSIKDLYLEAMFAPHPETGATGPWKLWLAKDGDLPISQLDALCCPGYRSIIINVDHTDDQILSSFVFELTNAANSKEFERLFKEIENGSLSRENFARAVEKVEHEGAMRHHKIMNHAITEMGWDQSMDFFKDYTKDFDRYWEENKYSDHVESSRRRWDFISQHSLPKI